MVCLCPADNKTVDSYRVTVSTDRMILVEDLLRDAKQFEGRAIFQEELTEKLASLLKARIETVGRHSGVETRCVCEWAE